MSWRPAGIEEIVDLLNVAPHLPGVLFKFTMPGPKLWIVHESVNHLLLFAGLEAVKKAGDKPLKKIRLGHTYQRKSPV